MNIRALACGLGLALTIAGCSARRAPVSVDLPPGRAEEGLASWYGIEEAGRSTASGQVMDPMAMTAAHKNLPFGSKVRVKDLETGRQVDVIINDRGPFVSGRIIDLSFAAARQIDLVDRGVTRVRIQVVGLEGPLAERRWRVQVGSFESERRAREVATFFQAEGYSPVVVSRFEESGSVFHRVWLGAYIDRVGAEGLARELHRDGHQGFVILGATSAP